MNKGTQEQTLMTRAATFAALAHNGQTRKGTALPYILHPMETAAIAATLTDDEEVLAAAVLHDVMEDCGVTFEELRVRFGPRVAAMVQAETQPKDGGARDTWQRRKLRAINHLRAASREEMILTLADKLSNLRAIARDLQTHGPALWQRFNQNNATLHHWYYASIGEGLKALEDTPAYREYMALLDRVFGPSQGQDGAASSLR